MRRTAEARDTMNAIIDDSIEARDGDVEWVAIDLWHELNSLDGGGIQWARDVKTAAMIAGLKTVVRRRIRQSHRIGVSGRSMPARYSINGESSWWLDAPASKLGTVAKRLISDAVSRFDHAEVLEQGRELAIKHRVATAAEGFAAEGIEITELAS